MHLGTERVPKAAVVWVLVVVQDHILVDLLESHASAVPEEVDGAADTGNQTVHLVECVVDRERGAHRRGDTEAPVQWRGAVVTDPNSHAVVVEHLADIMGVDSLYYESHR